MTGPPIEPVKEVEVAPVTKQSIEDFILANKELGQILQKTIEDIAREIAGAQQLSCDFVVSVTPILKDINGRKVAYAIQAGYPPVLMVNTLHVLKLITGTKYEADKAKRNIRVNISSAVSKLPRMQRTLAIQPIAEVIALQENFKKWMKTNYSEKIVHSIPDHHLEVTESYTIVMREITTGQSVTLTGNNPSHLRVLAKEKLTNLVAMSEVLADKLKEEAFVPQLPIKEIEVIVNPVDNTEEVNFKYEQ